MFFDNLTPMPDGVKKTVSVFLALDILMEIFIGFYLAIDYNVLELHGESIFYYLGGLILINICSEIGMLLKGYSDRNWFIVCRTRAFSFFLTFMIFITAAPGIVSDDSIYIDASFGAFFIISILYNLIAIWVVQDVIKFQLELDY